MIVSLDCMQAVFLCSLVDSRLDRIQTNIEHYEERKHYVSYETYITKTSYYRHEYHKLFSVRETLSRAISIYTMSDLLREEFGIDVESIDNVTKLNKYVVPEGDFDDDEFVY